jgi:protease-4
MADVEQIVDRRALRRKLFFWRLLAVAAVLAALSALLWSDGDIKKYRPHIARLDITGMITGDAATLALIDQIRTSSEAKGLIIRIDSPGGTTAGSEALYESLRKLAAEKPMVAVMDTVAASGGYITAISADHILARGNTITGSIGVIFSFPEVSQLLATLGIRMEEIKSGALKAEPSPYKPVSPEARAAADVLVKDSFEWFIGLVADRRSLPLETVRQLADGRVYTGRQAVANKLIDGLGGEEEAGDWLEKERDLAPDLPIVAWEVPVNTDPAGLGFSIGNGLLRALGLAGFSSKVERAQLDGLLVLWHPQL